MVEQKLSEYKILIRQNNDFNIFCFLFSMHFPKILYMKHKITYFSLCLGFICSTFDVNFNRKCSINLLLKSLKNLSKDAHFNFYGLQFYKIFRCFSKIFLKLYITCNLSQIVRTSGIH